jgi:hypothetical protein
MTETRPRRLFLVVLSFCLACSTYDGRPTTPGPDTSSPDGGMCYTGSLPGNFATTGALDLQPSLDEFSWQTFTYLNDLTGDTPLWSDWSSSDDLLEPIAAGASTPPAYGTHWYPTECQAISGYTSYRVIDQFDKIEDSFFEADTQGLSGDPLVDSNGNFLRYEILLSEATYDDIVQKGYYTSAGQADGVNLVCADQATNTGPADPHSGAMNLKLAWMQEPAAGQAADTYYSEKILVYTPAELTSDDQATCALETLYLVGLHIARKTQSQQGWIWSTFEHAANAPDCTTAPPGRGSHSQNTSCPALTGTAYNFLPSTSTCSAAGSGRCAACNSGPASNCSSSTGYCIDEAPAASGGYSALCRQVSTYDTSTNAACQAESNISGTVWAHYDLISTQWFAGDNAFPDNCDANQSAKVYSGGNVNESSIRPQVALQDGSTVPYMANTSMESYERSNCMGCHGKAVQAQSDKKGPSTDFVYYLMLEVEK